MKTMTHKHLQTIAYFPIKDQTLFVEVFKGKGLTIEEELKTGMYNEWDEKRIKNAFNFGKGTIKDFQRYASDNNKYADFIQIV